MEDIILGLHARNRDKNSSYGHAWISIIQTSPIKIDLNNLLTNTNPFKSKATLNTATKPLPIGPKLPPMPNKKVETYGLWMDNDNKGWDIQKDIESIYGYYKAGEKEVASRYYKLNNPQIAQLKAILKSNIKYIPKSNNCATFVATIAKTILKKELKVKGKYFGITVDWPGTLKTSLEELENTTPTSPYSPKYQ